MTTDSGESGQPLNKMLWDEVRGEFDFDSWRDIYLSDCDMAAWQRMLDGLRTANYGMEYFRCGQAAELPTDAAQAFPQPGRCDCLLSVRFSGVLANCHFFTPDEIEFDIDPREVKGQDQLDALLGFIRCLAESVGKDAMMTPENCPEIVIFRVRPGQARVEYQPFGGWH